MPKALITGIRGQDGSILAEQLLAAGYEIVGTTRDLALRPGRNLEAIRGRIKLVHCSYEEISIFSLLKSEQPNEVYNLAGQAYVGKSWLMMDETLRSAGAIPQHFLEAIRMIDSSIRFFQASSSQIYAPSGQPLTEDSRIGPNTPYGCSKTYAHFLVKSFRETHGLFAVNGILFNHESARRDDDFFVQKVVRGAVDISRGKQKSLSLGSLDISRDLGCAHEFMKAVQLTLAADQPEDYNICTGIATNLAELVSSVFARCGLDSENCVETNQNLIRRYEPELIVGDNGKISTTLGWQPHRSIFDVIEEMVTEAQGAI